MESIETQILHALNLLKDKKKPANPEFHIFYKLLNYIKDEISFEQEMYLIWIFTKSERSLKEARMGSTNLAKYQLDQINRNSELNSIVNFAFDFVVYPAKAFYFYNNLKSYDEAISLLIESINSINAIGEVYPELLSAAIEQYLNICRVLFRKNENMNAVSELGKLISSMLSGKCETNLASIGSVNALARLGDSEKNSMLDYVTDVAIYKILKININTDELLNVFLNSTNLNCISDENVYRKNYLKCLQLSIEHEAINHTTFYNDVLKQLPNLYLLPNALQYLFLKQIQVKFKLNNQLNESINAYFAKNLSLDYLFATTDDRVYQSPLRG